VIAATRLPPSSISRTPGPTRSLAPTSPTGPNQTVTMSVSVAPLHSIYTSHSSLPPDAIGLRESIPTQASRAVGWTTTGPPPPPPCCAPTPTHAGRFKAGHNGPSIKPGGPATKAPDSAPSPTLHSPDRAMIRPDLSSGSTTHPKTADPCAPIRPAFVEARPSTAVEPITGLFVRFAITTDTNLELPPPRRPPPPDTRGGGGV